VGRDKKYREKRKRRAQRDRASRFPAERRVRLRNRSSNSSGEQLGEISWQTILTHYAGKANRVPLLARSPSTLIWLGRRRRRIKRENNEQSKWKTRSNLVKNIKKEINNTPQTPYDTRQCLPYRT
jgi:hypothetical protein